MDVVLLPAWAKNDSNDVTAKVAASFVRADLQTRLDSGNTLPL